MPLDFTNDLGTDMRELSNLTAEEMKNQLSELARELVAHINEQNAADSHEILSAFVSELFLSAAQQSVKAERKKQQAEGIAAAKARGVRFGTKARPLPDNFDAVRRSWRNKEMNLKEAAKLCGMPTTTFYDAAGGKCTGSTFLKGDGAQC